MPENRGNKFEEFKNSFEDSRLKKAFNNSIEGLIKAFESEKAFRQDLIIFAIFFPIALFSTQSGAEKAILIMSLFLILCAELVNTSIEAIIDRISKEQHELSKVAKDIGSAVVLLSIINAIFVWVVVYSS